MKKYVLIFAVVSIASAAHAGYSITSAHRHIEAESTQYGEYLDTTGSEPWNTESSYGWGDGDAAVSQESYVQTGTLYCAVGAYASGPAAAQSVYEVTFTVNATDDYRLMWGASWLPPYATWEFIGAEFNFFLILNDNTTASTILDADEEWMEGDETFMLQAGHSYTLTYYMDALSTTGSSAGVVNNLIFGEAP